MLQVVGFLKTIVLTFIVVFILQIKIGEFTLEQRAHHFIQSSAALEPLRETASSAVTFMRLQGRRVSQLFATKVSPQWSASQIPGQRHLSLSLKRSESYERDQAEKRRQQQDSDDASHH